MHGKLKSLSLLLFLFIVFSCQTEQEVKPAKGKLSLSFSDNGNARTSEVFAPTAILITIKNSIGETVLDMQRLELYNFSGRFVTDNQEKLQLPVGTYQITDLLVVNAQNQVTHVVPKSGTPGANGVVDILHYTLTINADEETLTTFVVTKVEGQPSEYGYASFEVVESYPENNPQNINLKEHYIDNYNLDCQCFNSKWKYTFEYDNQNRLLKVDKYEIDTTKFFQLKYSEVFEYSEDKVILKTYAANNNSLNLHTTDELNYFEGKLAFVKHMTAYSNEINFTYIERQGNTINVSKGSMVYELVLDPINANVISQTQTLLNNSIPASQSIFAYSTISNPLKEYQSYHFPFHSNGYMKTDYQLILPTNTLNRNYSISTYPNSALAKEEVTSTTSQVFGTVILNRSRFIYF